MYKVGDKVKVISKEKFDELRGVRDHVRATKLDGVCHMTKSMARLCGRVVTIESVDEDGTYRIREDRLPRHWWSNSMFEKKETILATEFERYTKTTKEFDIAISNCSKFDTIATNVVKIKQAIQELGDSLVSIDEDKIVVKGSDYDIKVSFNR